MSDEETTTSDQQQALEAQNDSDLVAFANQMLANGGEEPEDVAPT